MQPFFFVGFLYSLIPMIKVPQVYIDFSRYFTAAGYSLYLVGGAVRDMLLEKNPLDYDFATDASPDAIMQLFTKVIPTGIEHGTVTVLYKGIPIEVTTFRIDGDYSDSRHPDQVQFASSIAEDLSRRDFTINAISVKMPQCELLDLYNGQTDLQQQCIRAIGNPFARLSEDPLRVLRGIRFSCVLGFSVDSATLEAMKSVASLVSGVAKERIREEWIKLLKGRHLNAGMHIIPAIGIQNLFFPAPLSDMSLIRSNECSLTQGVQAYTPQTETWIWRYSVFSLAFRKPNTANNAINKLFTEFLHFARYTKREIHSISELIRAIQLPLPDTSSQSTREYLFKLQSNSYADILQARKVLGLSFPDEELLEVIEREQMQGVILQTSELAVNGNDIAATCQRPPGAWLGVVMQQLTLAVARDPSLNTKEKLQELAKSILKDES